MAKVLRENSIWLGSCGAWHLGHTALAFYHRKVLAALWIGNKKPTQLPSALYRRCWPHHLAIKLFYHWAPGSWVEYLFYFFFPLWWSWLQIQRWPNVEVVQAICGFATEPFNHAEKVGAFKVIDCPNSHPATFAQIMQREFDLWCPGAKMPVPAWIRSRMVREIKRADLIVVQSKFCKETMVQNGAAPEKILINPMGVDTSIFKKREKVPEKIRFITVGTICLRKGHQYLFRAFEIVQSKLPEAELICVGGCAADFRKEWPKWKGSFTHHPRLPHDLLAPLLRTCTAFVFPSLEEGIARAQIEGLASGLPLIGTHEGGATTLVDDGVEGFIVQGREPKQIAEAMIKVALDQNLNLRMGEAAFRKGSERNSWQDYGNRLITEYEKRLEVR